MKTRILSLLSSPIDFLFGAAFALFIIVLFLISRPPNNDPDHHD